MVRTNSSYVNRIRNKYNSITKIWDDSDRWHLWTRRQIEESILAVTGTFRRVENSDSVILDIGSAGLSYFSSDSFRIDVDIAEKSLTRCRYPVCANAEALPFAPAVADLTICVGPVINYCSLEEVINELARTTKPYGHLVLHVELSNSSEFLWSDAYCADAAFVTSFYKGPEHYWVYSDDYVRRILSIHGFVIEKTRYFHILSSLAYRLTGRANLSSYLAIADRVLGRISLCGLIADSAIYFAYREVQS
jgi:SAM-dependent methyltransferase